ncbi:MAG: TIGR01212 family radical SAM protein [Deltaproteobacteria bacterium GWC2_42_51]|nr:MAG: TIGR01212 family radical SAM protein [Deltaproteobacteria bacterium GWB2_42_7]OGP34262.1 MAG: TIGR01212 family radical SAM protein [Deltaproteobacteria bacterium GWC2_42_51]OGP44632.1 MAG: TIGR01212 family radical SAM protein [Deltaproteobacteria bacterium GWD2_42_10]OGP47889.1 MAG: TIGR01212 family radical SAM protein [Deltaproteobacteria bacterium GWF2_42_12]OGQ25993.1 MAG: TIGR01212 family radical SAM protein [Deltaproteobacteria bacterium RIFCSPHIGHO2_02_FULL_42_44]OGQ35595.1 MAG: 
MFKRYNSLSDFLKNKFGCKVFKVSLNAGLTCPNRDGTKGTGGCIYCAPETLIPSNYNENLGIKEQLHKGIEYIRKRHKAEKFISYFQINTNTYASVSELEKLYREGIDHQYVVGMAVSTRPDCVDDEVLDLLKELSKEKFLWLELGLQSSHNKTLKLINRCHTVEDFTGAVERAKKRDIPVCAHVILGLPGEKKEDILNTARFLADLGIWGIKLHHTHIHKDTKLEEMYRKGEFRPLALEEYAELAVDFLQEMPKDVIIHRLCGDTSRRFLVAPDWSVNKFVILEKIHRIFEERNTYQGAKIKQNQIVARV